MDDTNLSGLDLDAAKEYIFAFAVDAKNQEKAIADARGELEIWKGRVTLAEGRLAKAGPAGDPSMDSLAQAARSKVEELAGKMAALEAERADLRSKIEAMRAQLPMIKARERSIDPDRLLAQLQMMTGELLGESPEGRSPAATEADFAKLESEARTDSELEALKRRAAEGDKP